MMNEIATVLTDHDISPTHQRVQIAAVLLDKPQHLSADQVLSLVNSNGSVVSKATVYNTLGLFARKGLLNEVTVDPSKVFYDTNTHRHYHFYNVDTGELKDIPPEALNIDDLPQAPSGTECISVDVILKVRANHRP